MRWVLVAASAVVILGLAGGGAFLLFGGGDDVALDRPAGAGSASTSATTITESPESVVSAEPTPAEPGLEESSAVESDLLAGYDYSDYPGFFTQFLDASSEPLMLVDGRASTESFQFDLVDQVRPVVGSDPALAVVSLATTAVNGHFGSLTFLVEWGGEAPTVVGIVFHEEFLLDGTWQVGSEPGTLGWTGTLQVGETGEPEPGCGEFVKDRTFASPDGPVDWYLPRSVTSIDCPAGARGVAPPP